MDAFKALFADVPSISIVYIRALIELGREHDVDLLPFAHELGINDTLMTSPEGNVSINQLLNLLEKAGSQLNDPCWSFKLGLSWGLQTHGMTSLPLFHRDNPFAIAKLALSNISLRLPFVALAARTDGDNLIVDLNENWPLGKGRRRVLDIYYGIMVRFISQMGKSLTICLDSDDPDDKTNISGATDSEVKLNHPSNQLIMRDFTDGQFVPNTRTTDGGELPANSQTQQMLLLIRRQVMLDPGRSCTIERVAEKLGSSTRTLSRYLRASNMSFSTLRNGVRSQHAERYLRDSSLPIVDIAERLGYSDQASFSKAFRSWTGQTPGDFRRSQAVREGA